MDMKYFPVIDIKATGKQISRLRAERGLSVKDLQHFLGFDAPQAIYKWLNGRSLPSIDNLLALSVLLDVRMEDILVSSCHASARSPSEPEGSFFILFFHDLSDQKYRAFSFGETRGKL